MSAFQPPGFRNNVNAMQQSTPQTPASPPRMGYVSGAEAPSELVGYVGTRPPVYEEPGNPQSRRQNTNFASPDPNLANSSFTHSQFTAHINAGAAQSAALRSQQSDDLSQLDPRREGLRRFKESNGGGPRMPGSCGMPPNLSSSQRGRLNRQPEPPQRSPAAHNSRNSSSPQHEDTVPASPAVLVAHNISDPEMMYKAFTGKQTWFRVAQLIVPPGRKPKKVSISSMFINTATADGQSKDSSYALRIVNPTESPPKVLWSCYSLNNTTDFEVNSTDCPLNATTLLEVQAVQDRGAPVLVSTILAEYE